MIVYQAYNQGKLLNETKKELGAMSEEDCVYLNRLLDISHRLVKLIDRGIENKAFGIKSEKIKYLFNVRNTMRMKMKHDLLAKALGSFHLSHHGVQFAGWRLKLLLETGSLFYRQ